MVHHDRTGAWLLLCHCKHGPQLVPRPGARLLDVDVGGERARLQRLLHRVQRILDGQVARLRLQRLPRQHIRRHHRRIRIHLACTTRVVIRV